MNMQPPSRWTSQDPSVLAAWRAQVTAAAHTPRLKQQLVEREQELLPCFVAHYTHLRALPRRVWRGLQRKWKQSLAGVALLLTLGQGPALAATINVNGSTCTLVDAITAANTDTATGGCPAGRGADTLVLPPGSTQTLTSDNNTFYGSNGLPVIRSVITIDGQGSTITRDSGARHFRILAVDDTGDLNLQQTIVSGGILNGGLAYSTVAPSP